MVKRFTAIPKLRGLGNEGCEDSMGISIMILPDLRIFPFGDYVYRLGDIPPITASKVKFSFIGW